MAAKPVMHHLNGVCRWNFTIPSIEEVSPHRSEPHPFCEPLAIHFPAQYAHLDQPDQVILCARLREWLAADGHPILLVAQLRAASSFVFQLGIKGVAKGQTAHGLTCPFQGACRYQGGG